MPGLYTLQKSALIVVCAMLGLTVSYCARLTVNELYLVHADEYFYYWHGWDLQYKWIRELYQNSTLADRHPEAIWQGG